MAKRSKRRLSRHERDQAGCIWSLINIFDFRNGRPTKRLLSSRKRVIEQVVGAGNSTTQAILPDPAESFGNLADEREVRTPTADIARTSVKELMEEEMVNEQGHIIQSNDSEKSLEHIDTKHGRRTKKNYNRKNRTRSKSRDMDVLEVDDCDHNPEQQASDNLVLQTVIEELANINQRNPNGVKHGVQGDLDIQSAQAVSVVEEKLIAAVKLFTEQKVSHSKRFGKEGKSCSSKEFIDALQTLSSNKGLFFKLLQDPNSVLVKHIQNLEDSRLKDDLTLSSLPGSGLSDEKKSDEFSSRKHHKFFRRRSKSLESFPVEKDNDCHSPSKIVILKPGPADAQIPATDFAIRRLSLQSDFMDSRKHNNRSASQFSFTEIKRKLRHAMGKERPEISPDGLIHVSPKHQNGNNGDKGITGENVCWSSPNRNHFYTERFAKLSTSFKKGEQEKDNCAATSETGQYARPGVSNIYVEAKKHLSEILSNGENAQSMTGQLPKSLGRILSLPEYNSSPCLSPRKFNDDVFVTAQMRLSPRGVVKNNVCELLQENYKNHPSPSRNSLECQPRILCGNTDNTIQSTDGNVDTPCTNDQESTSGILSTNEDSIVSEVENPSSKCVLIGGMIGSVPQDEQTESSSISAFENIQDGEIREGDHEESDPHSFKASPDWKIDSVGEDSTLSSRTASPSCSPRSKEVEESEYVIEKIERPSPVSVLEPLFADEDISPSSTISQRVEKEIQPRHIQFEEESSAYDHATCTRISHEDEESAFEYVEAVLLGSGLNWDEFLLRWLCLCEILDLSLFDEVELFSSRSRHDQKLLFDCANEALKDVCESYFGSFTGISHVKPNIRPVPTGMDLIHEVWERVEWHLFESTQPHSLDQLVRRDMTNAGKWMNLQSDIEHIGCEMEETIFDELVEDTVLSFIDDASEYDFTILPAECNANENAIL